ncbi:MAG: GNAT family N-acetyltransferase [Rhizobiaceae bacterium]
MDILKETGPEGLQVSAFVAQELLASLAKSSVQAENSDLVISARDGTGNIIGGITASTSYGWLLVKTLWVREENRGGGIGRGLVMAAHDAGRKAGCHAAWLDTSSAEARDFYTGLEYEVFGELANAPGQFPEVHKRWFMKRDL